MTFFELTESLLAIGRAHEYFAEAHYGDALEHALNADVKYPLFYVETPGLVDFEEQRTLWRMAVYALDRDSQTGENHPRLLMSAALQALRQVLITWHEAYTDQPNRGAWLDYAGTALPLNRVTQDRVHGWRFEWTAETLNDLYACDIPLQPFVDPVNPDRC